MRKPMVYIASPYSQGDKDENVLASLAVASLIRDEGKAVPVAPLLTHYWDQSFPAPYEMWLAMDLAMLERCDALLRLPGESSGADREVAHAVALGMPVFYSLEQLEGWIDG